MTIEIWIAVALGNYLSAVAPGQNVALISASTAQVGAKGGSFTSVGVIIADIVWCFLALLLAINAKEISPNVLTAVQVCSGLTLMVLGFNVTRRVSTMERAMAKKPQHNSTKLTLHGFGIGFANPLTLVFFLTLFPALLPAQVPEVNLETALFFGTAIVFSGFVALFPYILASLAISKAGFSKALNVACGSIITLVGGVVFVQSVI